jgi:hypothetical protein
MSPRQSEETPVNPNANSNGGAQTTQLSASPSSQQRSSSPASTRSANKGKGDDYVYFERSTDGFSSDAVSRATAAKLKLESYYKLAVDSAIERNGRCASHVTCLFPQLTITNATFCRRTELEHRLIQAAIPNEAREREIRKYRKLESQHLRLRRTTIRLTDFRTVKVIGKGAFGEVRLGCLLDCS